MLVVEVLVILLVVLFYVSLPALSALMHRHMIASGWRKAGRTLGLDVSYRFVQAVRMAGRLGAFVARVELDKRSSLRTGAYATRYVIEGNGLSSNLLIAGSEHTTVMVPAQYRVRLGDATFDANVSVSGRRDEVLALLDAPTRSALMRFVENGKNHYGAGRLVSERTGRDMVPEQIVTHMEEVAELAKRLTIEPDAIPARLATNAEYEPDARVRRANLDTLIAVYRDSPEGERR